MSFFHKKMSQNFWATIMPFGPETNFLLAQIFFPGPTKGWPSFQALHYSENLSKRNILGTNFCDQNRQVFNLSWLNQQTFPTFEL